MTGLPRRAVIVFARLPVVGQVKTRLARTLGSASAATDFYKACAEHAFRQARGCAGARVVVYHANAGEDAAVRDWVSSCCQGPGVAPQLDVPDLGARMHAALATELRTADQVIIVGSDIPDVAPAMIVAAFTALDSHSLVLGPACDGGFYCIGATSTPPEFLTGLTWSTEHVLRDTVAHAEALGMTVAPAGTLPALPDIDTAQDLRDWVAQSAGHPLQQAAQAALAAAVPRA